MNLDFNKHNGLIPVIIQDSTTMQVLMLGYMNEEAYIKTQSEGKVTFFSRSKNRLWTKGEESGHDLIVDQMLIDCDNDTLLIKATPKGPTCHTGSTSCFGEETARGFLYALEKTITLRIDQNTADSYTNKLYHEGINKVAQKFGEEAVELLIEAMDHNLGLFENEAADVFYHLLLLLKRKESSLSAIESILKERSEERK